MKKIYFRYVLNRRCCSEEDNFETQFATDVSQDGNMTRKIKPNRGSLLNYFILLKCKGFPFFLVIYTVRTRSLREVKNTDI